METYERADSFVPTAVQAIAPLPPTDPPRPLGELSTASVEEVLTVTCDVFGRTSSGQASACQGAMAALLRNLTRFPGTTWQERWEAAGLNERGRKAGTLHQGRPGATTSVTRLNTAAGYAFLMRLVQPSLLAFRSYTFPRYIPWFREIAKDPLLEEFCTRSDARDLAAISLRKAKYDICAALTVYGISLADLTPEGLMHYAAECRKYGVTFGENAAGGCFAATKAWPVLVDMGHFPASTPGSMRSAITRGQLTVAELVDKHKVRNTEVRELLIDYISRRRVEIDYSTLQQLVLNLVKLFWKTVEEIRPDQADLRLDEETITYWKERLLVRPDGKPRLHIDSPFMAVRGLYLDIHTWAAAEPERWAKWSAPCPIRDEDLRWFNVRRRRLQERTANRIRERQPLLPVLAEHVTEQWHRQRTLLAEAKRVGLGEEFTVDGTTWQRVIAKTDLARKDPLAAPVRAVNRTTGQLVWLTHLENQAFWQWAVVETLRLAGLRAEELTELTHLSVRNYQRPSGEVVALLVISPSKSDRERVIPMSGELFHVIAQIIRRHMSAHGTVPICTRYDLHEKVWSEPLPYLFQTLFGGEMRAMSTTTLWRMIRRATDSLTQTDQRFAEVKFAAHDFRRLFATDLVNNGLPIHIGAALLGHLNIQTTRGYVAVFDEDVVRHYQEFLDRRRAQRPEREYRKPTRSGTSSTSTSTNAASNSAPAAVPTERHARTNTPASAAPCSASTRRCCPALTSWRKTSSPAASAPLLKVGEVRLRASTSRSPSCAASGSRPGASSGSGRSLSGCQHPADNSSDKLRHHGRPSELTVGGAITR
ncbi:tyrosine-type recombinase/integrase [Kitasatospora phosalacinea]|uniref:tyrosine-type recombinase/integrase n=1 Tax=Kitasatospora phosalacinea TaxID=2065 RepID=UPI00365984A1